MKKEKNRLKFWDNVHISMYSIITFIVGILILLGLHCYENGNAVPVLSREDVNSLYIDIVQPVAYNVAIILIVLAVGTFFFELYGYLSYFRKRISEVFSEFEMIDILDNSYKKDLKYNLVKSIYKPNNEDSRDMLTLFEDKIANTLECYYYKDYDIHIDYQIYPAYIEKTITRRLLLKEVDTNKNNEYAKFISVTLKKLDGKEFNLEYVKCNGQLCNKSDYRLVESETTEPLYNQNYTYEFTPPKKIDDELEVEIKYTTRVPTDDLVYTITLDKLCKQMRCVINFDKKRMCLQINGFKFATEKNMMFSKKYYPSSAEAFSGGWLLPGEGIACAAFPKQE